LGREISEQKDYSDKTAREIDEEVYSIIQRAYNTAKKILSEHKAKLTQIAVQLIANETLEEASLNKLFKGLTPQPSSS
jgi:cell division protease FtsH